MADLPLVSIVLGSYNRFRILQLLMDNLRSQAHDIPHEIVVVEGGSTDGALEWIVEQKDVITIVQHNRGEWLGKPVPTRSWGYFMNLGFQATKGKYILMVSDDTLLIPGALKNGVGYFEKLLAEGRRIGAMAFFFRDLPYTFEPSYRVQLSLNHKLYVNHGLFLRSAVENVGWIEEEAYHFYCADQDLCLKLWHAGYEILDCPNAFLEHFDRHEVRTTGSHTMMKDNETMIARWKHIFPPVPNPEVSDLIRWVTYNDPHRTGDRFIEASSLPARIAVTWKRAVWKIKGWAPAPLKRIVKKVLRYRS